MSAQEARTPPQNLEAEQSVLGAMMVSSLTLDPVILDVRLEEEDFYRERHRLIYRMIKKLMEEREAVDALTVSEALAANGILEEAGGKGGVAELAASVPAAGNAAHYAKIVKANAQLRRLLAASQKIQQSVFEREGEPRDLVERAESELFKVARDETSGEFHLLAAILEEETTRLEKLAKGEAQLTGTASGFRDLDDTLGGFQPGNLIILAARPSMGKSALVCNIAENVSMKGDKPVAFFSLEMSETEIAHRFIACRARINGDKMRKGQVSEKDWPRVIRACNELEHAPLWIDDSSDLSMLELRAKCRRLAANQGDLGLVIVDYIQLMRPDDPRSNRVEQVGQFSRGLKILARELQVPVIGLSQLSRAPDQRTGAEKGVPMLSDLRESGCLTGESRVLLADEGRYVPIRELVGRSGFKVMAVDTETWKLEPRPVARAFSTGRKRVFKLRTALGKEIRATGNHKFLALDGWHRLDELEVGTRVAVHSDEHAGREDVLPRHAWTMLAPAQPALAGVGARTDDVSCGSTLYKAAMSRERAARVAKVLEIDSLSKLARSDVYWDTIVSIEPDGEEEVFDLTVEGLHSFVADDVVVHNSIEQDADVVMFIYRESKYHEEADDSEADLIVAKHRNGPVGKVPMVFLEQYPRFVDRARGSNGSGPPIVQAAGEGPPMADVGDDF